MVELGSGNVRVSSLQNGKSVIQKILKSHLDQAILRSSILFNMDNVVWDHVHTGVNGESGTLARSHVAEVSKSEPEAVKMVKWAILGAQI